MSGQNKPVDLLAALQATVDQLRAARGPQSETTDDELDVSSERLQGRTEGIRLAANYITRMGGLMGSNEQRLKMLGVPEFLRELADAVEAEAVKL